MVGSAESVDAHMRKRKDFPSKSKSPRTAHTDQSSEVSTLNPWPKSTPIALPVSQEVLDARTDEIPTDRPFRGAIHFLTGELAFEARC